LAQGFAMNEDALNIERTAKYASHIPVDVAARPVKGQELPRDPSRDDHHLLGPHTHIIKKKDTVLVNVEIKLPPKKKKPKPPSKVATFMSALFNEERRPTPLYYEHVDAVAVPGFLTPKECKQLIAQVEANPWKRYPHKVMNFEYQDIVDPYLGSALWSVCGLAWFMSGCAFDGLVPAGLNDVIRIQKYSRGQRFARHVDQTVERADGKASRYSLRIFLNDGFDGGSSKFWLPGRTSPIVFAPEVGLALVYPQGDQCTPQEESEILTGCKYVLRADILFEPRVLTDAERAAARFGVSFV